MPSTRWLPVLFFLFVWTLTTHGKYSVSGDEPHYLMVAHSLVTDRDFDVLNNYRNNDGRRFGHDGLQPERHARTNAHGAVWSMHDPGLSILIAPAYAVATRLAALVPGDLLARVRQSRGLFTYSLVSLSVLVLAAWGVSLVLSGLLRFVEPGVAVAVTAAMAFSPPFMSHAFLVFPDTVAAVVCCAVVWLLCLRPAELTSRRMMLMALGLGLLPWLHRRYALLALGLAIVIAHRHWTWLQRQRPRLKMAIAGLIVLPAAGLFVWTWMAWGNLGGPQGAEMPFSVRWVPTGSLGLLFDRERGLVSYAPVFLLIPACWVLAWRAHWTLVVPVACVFVPTAAFLEWFAGFSPAARYLVPIVPLLALPAAYAMRSRGLRWIALPVVLFQAAISAYVWQFPRTLWPRETGSNQVLEAIPFVGPLYAQALPSMLTGDSVRRGLMTAAAVAGATVVMVLIGRTRGHAAHKATPEPFPTDWRGPQG